jgi:hypothetical protein
LGVTALLCADSGLEIQIEWAMTVSVYVTPLVSPDTIALRADPGTSIDFTMPTPT